MAASCIHLAALALAFCVGFHVVRESSAQKIVMDRHISLLSNVLSLDAWPPTQIDMMSYSACSTWSALWTILFHVCLSPFLVSLAQKPPKVVVNIVGVNNCSETQKTPNYVRNAVMTKHGRDSIVLNMEAIITANPANQEALAEFFKCTNRAATQCEQFMRIPMPKICDLVRAKGQFWSPFFDSIHPPLDCPRVKPGVYQVVNATFDTSKLIELTKQMPDVTDYYWKQTLKFLTKSRILFCFYYVLKLDKIRH